jgi:hypothetical protein
MVALCGLACATSQIQERCRFVTHHVPQPPMPSAFAVIDRQLIGRAIGMTQQCREMKGSYSFTFRVNFAERLLPDLCDRLERARSFAAGGSSREAGRLYGSLLVASQVLELAVATISMAEYADKVGMPTPKIDAILNAYADHVGPILVATAQENPEALGAALDQHSADFVAWIEFLQRWSARLQQDEQRVKVAKQIWDTILMAAAAYEAAGALAEMVASGRPPIPPMAAVGSGAAVVAVGGRPVSVELVQAIRQLISSGALDASVVVGLSKLTAPVNQMAAPEIPASTPEHSGAGSNLQPTDSATYPDPDGLRDLAKFRKDLGMPDGKGTLARLDVQGRTFYGISAHGQEVSLSVNNVSRSHAEADAFEQAARVGVRGGRARMFVDRKLCTQCGRYGGVRGLVRQLGLQQLEVITPEGILYFSP